MTPSYELCVLHLEAIQKPASLSRTSQQKANLPVESNL